MQVLEKNKREVEARAKSMSDFLRMEYLESCVRKFLDPEILRYAYLELSKLYEARIMYTEALKYIAKYKELCILQRERTECIIKEIELFIKAGNYERADIAYKEACKDSTEKEKIDIRSKMVQYYKNEVMKFEKSAKNAAALKVYEKLILYVTEPERTEIKKKMINAFQKLGKIRESIELERQLNRGSMFEDRSIRRSII